MNLAERVEQSEGPSRELDAEIACAHHGLEPVLLVATGKEVYGAICDPSDGGYGTSNTCTRGYCYARFPDKLRPPTLGGGKRGNIVQGFTPASYTASIDSALTLVPEGWEWVIDSGGHVELTKSRLRGPHVDGNAATPALAICAAALRTREQD
jgi:hypothetical protein